MDYTARVVFGFDVDSEGVFFQWMFAFALVCVLWGSSLSLSLSCNIAVVISDRSHGFGLCAICGLTGIFWNCFLEMEVGDGFLSHWQVILILGSYNNDKDESLGDSLHEGQLSALRVFGGSVTGFKAQKLLFVGGG